MIRKFGKVAAGAVLSAGVVVSPAQLSAQNPDGIFDVPERPSLNFYGTTGLIDMPSAQMLPDGQVAIGISNFGGSTRTTLTFQATPRIQASFRYTGIKDANFSRRDTYRDRSFDVRFLLNRESRYLPSLTVGLQDFAGTGIYAGEFVAATKQFSGGRIPGTINATVGLGWGRLGSSGSIGAPFGQDRPTFVSGDLGGEFSVDQWFQGQAAPFAGVEWQLNDKWGFKAEYSSDAYRLETSNESFERKSRLNFGAEYQVSDSIRLGGYYLYGSEFGVNLQVQLNPNRPLAQLRMPPPQPYRVRPSRTERPEQYGTAWAASEEEASARIRDDLIPLMREEGLSLIETRTTAASIEVRFSNNRHAATAVAVGRVARILARLMPASVETFRIVPVVNNLAQSAIVLRRSDLEALETSPDATNALIAVTGFDSAAPGLPGSARNETLFPSFNWSFGPYAEQRLFDPEEPLRIEAGAEVNLSYQPAPGWKIAGQLRYRLTDTSEADRRVSNSVLPRVRTDGSRYLLDDRAAVSELYISKQWKAAPDVYARVSAGYLERMFGGVSAEVLWKPVSSRLAFGVEANYVQQRAFDDVLGFEDYSVATGHASVYYEFTNGYNGQLDVGRYLAGDVGATVTLEREFENGWRLGGFFTLTDVSAEDFGEGSFDKGITLTIPLGWVIGQPDRRLRTTTVRPLTRDGGARLNVPGRLYDQVRSGHRDTLVGNWSGVWE